jgi:hypothetical protein
LVKLNIQDKSSLIKFVHFRRRIHTNMSGTLHICGSPIFSRETVAVGRESLRAAGFKSGGDRIAGLADRRCGALYAHFARAGLLSNSPFWGCAIRVRLAAALGTAPVCSTGEASQGQAFPSGGVDSCRVSNLGGLSSTSAAPAVAPSDRWSTEIARSLSSWCTAASPPR